MTKILKYFETRIPALMVLGIFLSMAIIGLWTYFISNGDMTKTVYTMMGTGIGQSMAFIPLTLHLMSQKS